MKFALKLPKRNGQPRPAAGSGSGRVSLERLWLAAFFGMVLVLGSLAFLLHRELVGHERRAEHEEVGALVQGFSIQIAEVLKHYAVSMDYVARDPALAKLIRSGDRQAIRDRETALGYLFPSSLRVRLLKPGIETPDTSTSPPLGYACLDMLRQAETSDRVPAVEVHNFGTPQQHIDMVRSVRGADGKPVGNLLVALSVPLLQQTINRLPLEGGYIELSQAVPGGAPLVLAARGSRPRGHGQPLKSLPIPGTRWRLAYWPVAAGAGLDAGASLLYWGAFGTALLLLALVLFLLYRRMSGALQQDQITVIRLVKDMAEGTLASSYPVRVRNCRGTIEQLHYMAKERHGDAPAAAAGKAPATDLEDLFPDLGLGALQVEEIDEFAETGQAAATGLPAHIFRAYDIRGVVGESLTPGIVREIGRAVGSEAYERGQQKVIVARDGRLSSPELSAALIEGLVATGMEVIDVGRVPTPVLYFATRYLGSGSGVVVTGSHNPADYNGLKIMLRGETLHDEDIQSLRKRIESGELSSGEGKVQALDVVPSYLDRITSDVRLVRPLKVVVDCGNGVTGELGPQLLRALGCEVVELYCEIDGNFPNHHPDPGKPENLIALTRAVGEQQADLGVAFDGDGDRLGVVDADGKIIWPDRLLMLLAVDVLLRQPGAQIIYDVKCSRHLERVITEHGGQPLMWKTGHSFIKAKMQETGAQLAGEMSGHIFFQERWFGFDDALYACARLLEILAADPRPSSKVFATLPESVSTPELNAVMAEGEHFGLMQRLVADAHFGGARLITIDGLRVEFPDGWGLVRASNTTPSLVMRFEADDAAALRRIQDEFRHQLQALEPDLELPF